MRHILALLVIYALGGLVVAGITRSLSARQRNLAALCFVAHAVAAPLQVVLTQGVLGGGDMFAYYTYGVMLADWARFDVFSAVPEILRGAVRLPAEFPFALYGDETSPTGAMQCLSGLLMLMTGDSLYGACAVIGSANAIGQVITFMTVRRAFPPELHGRIAVALLLTPSVIFWTSGLLKESIAMIGFAPLVAGGYLVMYDRRRMAGFVLLLLGALPFYVLKPYVLAGFVIAGPVLAYARRAVRLHGEVRFRPVPLALASAVAVGGIAVLGWLFPQYSLEEVAEEAARLQEVGGAVEGGSNIEIVGAPTRSLAGQLAYAPLALFTTLFRPFLFEARGAAMLLAALESTVLTVLFVVALRTDGRARIANMLRRSPLALAAVTFACVIGVAVGLASTNLGTLSRYRVPMMPFWVFSLALATAPVARASAAQIAPTP